MNTHRIRRYAPKARQAFIQAVRARAQLLGIVSDQQIDPVSVQGEVMQIGNRTFPSDLAPQRERLVNRIKKQGLESLVEQVAYSWFNRFCAIRYMEVHDYLGHGLKVLEHFEILQHAADAAAELEVDRATVLDLKLNNKDEELYRLLLLAQCHRLHQAMPFLFEAIDDETELLLPENLTRTDSLVRSLVTELPEEDWQQVEVIGWLYQFYISEKKDQVIGGVVSEENIPAATQLFTPNWIVQYLVQNSVGRQWLQTYPDSDLLELMPFYVQPPEQSDDVAEQLSELTPVMLDPKEIKVLDPACGSGHILVEAYNLLKAIYGQHGYRSRDIPGLILTHNLYGLDIDDRAAQLAGFALMMKAREDDRRIFTRGIRLNIMAMQSSESLDFDSVWQALNLSGASLQGASGELFAPTEVSESVADSAEVIRRDQVKQIVGLFAHAKTFGSLIQLPAELESSMKVLCDCLIELCDCGDTVQTPAARQLLPFIQQACLLTQRYDSVVANPPYLGAKGMNTALKKLCQSSVS